MKKTLIALSVAALAVPFTAAADGHEGGSNLTVSGAVGIQIAGSDEDDSELTLKRDDVQVNFAADTAFGNGLTGYGNILLEAEAGNDGTNVADGVVSDAVKVGIKGGFGDVSFGDVGSGYGKGLKGGDLFDRDPGNNEGIAYSNTFGAVGMKASLKLAGNNGGDDAAFSIGADYTMDNGLALGAGMFSNGDESRVALGAGFSMSNGLGLGVSVESIEDGSGDNEADAQVIGAHASYAVGGWSLAGKMYTHVDGDDDIGSKIRVEGTKALADDLSLNIRVNSFTDDAGDGAGDVMDYRVLLTKSF